jgi:DNA-binding beta-propeller fold protein YncE
MWVTNSDGDTVTKLRADGAVLGTFNLPDRPYDVAFDGPNIWIANFYANKVTKLRASDGAVMRIFSAGISPQRAAFDGANIWVVNAGSNTMSKM